MGVYVFSLTMPPLSALIGRLKKGLALLEGVDLEDQVDKIVLRFVMPGLRKEDIELYVDGRAVRVKAKIPEEVRRFYISPVYHRYLVLPSEVNPDNVIAKYENGLLTVILPKKIAGKKINVE